MAYNYLELVNNVCRKLNDVELTSDNFADAKGFYSHIKDAVNSSIRDINQTHYQWPFNHVLQEEFLSEGVSRYAYPSDASTIDFDSFRIKEDVALGNDTQRLSVITYDTYLQQYVDQEYTEDESKRGLPMHVAQSPSYEYVVTPAPDQDYEIVYEYYRIPVDLNLYSDVPSIPERFKHIIVDGAMYYAYMFRGNEQSASMSKSKFEEGLKRMRIILINRYEYVTSTMLVQPSHNISGPRVG